jgi:hypothetical protein
MKRSRTAGAISSMGVAAAEAGPGDAAPREISGSVAHRFAQDTDGDRLTAANANEIDSRPATARARDPPPRHVAQHLANYSVR